MDYLEEQLAICCSKRQYFSEEDARALGRERATEANIELFVYHCPYCKTWHLTKRERPVYWNVSTDFVELDDYEDMLGDKLFWDRLQDMPIVEALEIAQTTLLKVKQVLSIVPPKRQHEPDAKRWLMLHRRLEAELVFRRRLHDTNAWRRAIKMLYGEEAYDRVVQLVMDEQGRIDPLNDFV